MTFILASSLALLPHLALAEDIWCMPTTICYPDRCLSEFDEESSVRLSEPFGGAATLRSHAETIPMTLTHEGRVNQWEGTNEQGHVEILAVRQSDMAFTYIERGAGGERTAKGRCEVQ